MRLEKIFRRKNVKEELIQELHEKEKKITVKGKERQEVRVASVALVLPSKEVTRKVNERK